MKTLSFNKILKYALLFVTLLTLFLGALFIFIPKNQITASAHDSHLTQNSYDFRMSNVSSFANTTDSGTSVAFTSLISTPRNTDINNAIKENSSDSKTDYPGYSYEQTTTSRLEYYVVLVLTTNLQHYYNCLEYGSVLNSEASIANLQSWFSDCKIVLSNVSSNNVLGVTNVHNAGSLGQVEIDYDTYTKNTNYYAFAVTVKYTSVNVKTNTSNTTTRGLYVTNKTENYLEFNEVDSVKDKIKNNPNYEDYQYRAFQEYLGCYNSGNTTINVNYINMKNFTEYENKTVSFTIEGVYAQTPYIVEEVLYNTLANQGFSNLTDFNATYTDTYVDGDGTIKDLSEKTIRIATGLNFEPDFTQNKTQTINVTYSDFNYSDVALYVSNNGYDIDTELLTMPVYTTDNNFNNGIITITFDFSKIQRQLYNTCKWIFTLEKDKIYIDGKSSKITTNLSDTALTISFSENNQNELFGLSLKAVAEIIPDFELTYTINYAELDNNLNETIKTSAPYKVMYTEFINLTNSTNFYNKHGELINGAISPSSLNGEQYYIYNQITASVDKANATATVNVEYNYNTTFKVILSNGEVFFTPLNKSNKVYKFKELNYTLPKNYRISNITGDDGFTLEYNDVNPAESVITVGVANDLKKLLTLNTTITDKWILSINYLTQYKETPFAQLNTVTKEVRIADFTKSIYNFNAEDVAQVLGVQSLKLLASAPEKINVTFEADPHALRVATMLFARAVPPK